MANTTAPAKPAADVKDEAVAPAAEATDVTNQDISQAFRLLRFKLNSLATDARRKNPFLSRTQDEAKAKFNAAYKTIVEMADFLDQQKTV